MSLIFNKWWQISICVSIFGFLKEFRPSEPFFFCYLIGPWRNVTAEEINQKAFPVNTWTALSLLIIVFLITDLCRYKPLIILLGISGIIIWSMLLWTTSLLELQLLEMVYGVYIATEVGYFTYMYAKVPKEYYQKVTGHARAAILTGRCSSAILAQILVSFDVMDYRQLNYLSLATQIAATIWSFFIPSVDKSIYFNQENLKNNTSFSIKMAEAFALLWKHFLMCYSKVHVFKWSLWWAFITCIYIQLQFYMQPLWAVISHSDECSVQNGIMEALAMLLGIVGSLAAAYVKTNWEPIRDFILTVNSAVIGALLLITSQTSSIFISYGCYVVFNIIYQYMFTVANAEVSKYILDDTYGLVFGINTFIALLLQMLLTLIVVNGDVGFGLSERDQFVVYGSYCFFIAAIYFIIGFISFIKSFNHKNKSFT